MSKKNAILILLFVSVSKMLNAQTANVADQLVENSKLNAVIVVAAIILLGIFIFLFSLEKKIKKKKKITNLYWLSHYFSVAKFIHLDSHALTFIKQNNSNFTYSCENTKQTNPNGRSFSLKTDFYSFFKKYGREIE